jgi:hypothetical protein
VADLNWYPDTLDLQDHYAPSAKDHTHAVHTNDDTGLAPHQEKEVRHADHNSKAEIMHGPTEHDGTDIYDGTDNIHIGLGVHRDETDIAEAEDGEHSEGEDDDLLDDDLMDKISSSPSIDDGMLLPCARGWIPLLDRQLTDLDR